MKKKTITREHTNIISYLCLCWTFWNAMYGICCTNLNAVIGCFQWCWKGSFLFWIFSISISWCLQTTVLWIKILELLMDAGLSVACYSILWIFFFSPSHFFLLQFSSLKNCKCLPSLWHLSFKKCDLFSFLCYYLSFNLNYVYCFVVFLVLSFWLT